MYKLVHKISFYSFITIFGFQCHSLFSRGADGLAIAYEKHEEMKALVCSSFLILVQIQCFSALCGRGHTVFHCLHMLSSLALGADQTPRDVPERLLWTAIEADKIPRTDWCLCPTSEPYCSGSSCATALLDSGHVSVFPATCHDCGCHDSYLMPTRTPEELFSRYEVLHSLMLRGERPLSALSYQCRSTCGGIGDRLRGIYGLFYFAVLTERAYSIDFGNPSLDDVLEPHRIAWRQLPSSTPSSFAFMTENRDNAIRAFFQSRKSARDGEYLSVQTNQFGLFHLYAWDEDFSQHRQEGHHFRWGWIASDSLLSDKQGIFQTRAISLNLTHVLHPIKSAYDFLFKPATRVKEIIARAHDLLGQRDGQTRYLGIHLRTGNYGTTFSDPRRTDFRRDFDRIMACIASKAETLGSDVPWYLASDSSKAIDDIIDALRVSSPSQKIVTIHDLGGIITHTDKPNNKVDAASGNIYAFAEHIILKDASLLVASVSGFSRLAAAEAGRRVVTTLPDCKDETLLY